MKGPEKTYGGEDMDDTRIVELYWERSQSAVEQTHLKYGKYCHTIAYNILYSNEDAEECVNDTYVRAWSAMPPHKPNNLSGFLGRITRNLALDRYDRRRAAKRSGNTELALEELAECIPNGESSLSVSDAVVLKDAINGFLASLPKNTRIIFMRRYWYLCSITEIAKGMGMSESNVKVSLMRTRKLFREYLEKEGFVI